MFSNQISAFEYVSILVSIILGLGITQLLSASTDLLFRQKEIKHYWPHSIWMLFILFLLLQDWFITYQLKNKLIWTLPELMFVLLYPITLFIASKILLLSNEIEKYTDIKLYYFNNYRKIFLIFAVAILISILFNILFLEKTLLQQTLLIIFLSILVCIFAMKITNESLHKWLAIVVAFVSLLSVIIEKESWIIK